MKSKIQKAMMWSVAVLAFSSLIANQQANIGVRRSGGQQSLPKRSIPLPHTPHAGGDVPACPTGGC